ncbi:MAG: exodeoxyribonuclease VII small subunit [Candidatus Kerfeldbacteria bacterium CG_4_10_14_0_8_um_filter_42_10]|uniref:Exodeoxyribonuclease 7 small subunit n=1 Tax=Candidatus Kerfeldbacteria bacterium CG_4_10_14_0_8_um_filter_42_10 TaxID=2014248 RepID=A0A2M7RH76_9BACT|nr:MAG: exodeoxyribonuclease VII small subunit [Candidatus Kerfeldbacteria bacterium CG_4_10_14_0_8_um_filter_42_10]
MKKKTVLKSKLNFAEAFAELEKITEEFENETVDLESGLKKFERGLELASELKARLKEVENKVEIIKKKFEE